MILAGDVGGTKTLIGLFERRGEEIRRIRSASFTSADYPGIGEIVSEFLPEGTVVTAACFGIAGPVLDNRVDPPNLPWREDGTALGGRLGFPAFAFLNDLHATALGIPALTNDEILTLAPGDPHPAAPLAIIAAGTGLGMAVVAGETAIPSEGGHAAFAPRNEEETALRHWLAERKDHVEVEDVVSGPGLANIHEFLTGERADPAEIAAAGGDAVRIFLGAYGSAAGDLALLSLPRRGLYVGGGIAPRLIGPLSDGTFLEAFLAKGRSRSLLETIPVRVILNPETALLGAARHARSLADRPE